MEFDNVILASASPRRRELLKFITDDFIIKASSAEETVPENLPAEEAPEFLAMLKAKDIATENPQSLVIGADTCVIADGKILGKPKDKADAVSMLKALSGKTHKVITGCALAKEGRSISFSVTTEVEFFPLSEQEIMEYAESSEPFDKAGSYGIQGKGGLFVKKINGDYFNVVGLPIAKLKRVINSFSNLTK